VLVGRCKKFALIKFVDTEKLPVKNQKEKKLYSAKIA
jgi:hypothetical protein